MSEKFWELTPAEAAGMEAWQRGSADSTQALVAIRAALHHVERSEDARLAVAEDALAEIALAANESVITEAGMRSLLDRVAGIASRALEASRG